MNAKVQSFWLHAFLDLLTFAFCILTFAFAFFP